MRAGDVNASKDIGTEIDIRFDYKLTDKVTGTLGYNYLFAGDFLSDTGSDEDIQFAFAQLLYEF